MELVGRKVECNLLKNSVESDKSELIAVYGRRRIGKTFLIRQYFKDKFAFYTTGIYEGTKCEQLSFFNKQLNACAKGSYPLVNNWFDAFDQLKHHLLHCKQKTKVVFIDELPWMDIPRSRFLKAFETFWNSWGSAQADLKLIVCGSATSWIVTAMRLTPSNQIRAIACMNHYNCLSRICQCVFETFAQDLRSVYLDMLPILMVNLVYTYMMKMAHTPLPTVPTSRRR